MTAMSKAEILAELVHLGADERSQVFHRLCELQDDDLRRGVGPSTAEMKLLDEALIEYQQDNNPGTPWRTTLQRIRASRRL